MICRFSISELDAEIPSCHADFYKDGTLNGLTNIQFIRTNGLPGKDAVATVLARPSEVFFKPTEQGADSLYEVYKRLFLFVDFGKMANGFLEAVGVKHQPSTSQLATMLVSDPHKFLGLAGTAEV